jgi:hypothetical protein
MVKLSSAQRGGRATLAWSQHEGTTLTRSLETGAREVRRLGPHTVFRVQPGAFASRFSIAEQSYSVPRYRLDAVLDLIALTRLGGAPAQIDDDHPFCDALGPPERAALSTWLAEGEVLLGMLRTQSFCDGASAAIGPWRRPYWLLLTERSLRWVAVSPAGDLSLRTLPASALGIEGDQVILDGGRLKAANQRALLAITRCAGHDGADRVVESAREAWILDRKRHSAWALRLLRSPKAQPSAVANLMLRWLGPDRREAEASALPSPTSTDLAALWSAWELTTEDGYALLAQLKPHPEWRPRALELCAVLWQALGNDEAAFIRSGLDHAECLLEWNDPIAATGVLELVRGALPAVSLADVELPTGLIRAGQSGARRRLAELTLRAAPLGNDCATARRLLALAPLDLRVLERVRSSCRAGTQARANTALLLLTEPGAAHRPRDASAPLNGLSAQQLERVRHPLAAGHERFLARVSALTAKTERPDFATLKLYCERVTESASEVSGVVDDAATLLGIGHVDVYVSRGHDDVGFRAFKDRETVLLIGGQHLDEKSRYHMDTAELMFAVASELAHLRFEHARVAPKDVARGMLDKGKQGVDIALSLLPVMAGLKLADRLGVITAKLSLPKVGQFAAAAKDLQRMLDASSTTAPRSDLSQANETLVEAHRFAQLSADRAGLIACGDLATAIRSMLLGRTDYARVSTRLGQLSVLDAMAQQHASNPRAFDDLKTRLGFLLAFYVEDEFADLRSAATRLR